MTRNLLILRSKVTFFQKFFIPASMLAGFLGLLLGSQFLNVIHFSDAMSSYAGLLVIPVFAIIGLNRFSKGGGKEGSKEKLRRVSGNFFFFTTKGRQNHSEVSYPDDNVYIIFGREDAGIDEKILHDNIDRCVRIPMRNTLRSLNLSNSVAIAAYEVLRQWDYPDLSSEGRLTKY